MECFQPVFSPKCNFNIKGDCNKNGECYYQLKFCPNCKKPMRLERETKTERIWVCDYCGMGSEISS